MNDAKTDETTLRALTSRFDAIQAAADRSAESPQAATRELDALEVETKLTPPETVVYWTRLASLSDRSSYRESVISVHQRLVGRILTYFGVSLP